MELLLVSLYCGSLLVIFIYSLGQLHLTWIYRRSHRKNETQEKYSIDYYPHVTIQLPIYNEMYVVERLIDHACKLNYPKDKLEIQVLDDSNDETSDLIRRKVDQMHASGLDIQHIQRGVRDGFKAGALQYGTDLAKGDFIAIFDADFIPPTDFLIKSMRHFQNEKIGMVQSRWGHINKGYSILTRMQAFGLDAHFTVEQAGRNANRSFINFNGTAGIWRKECIIDAGGWSADTLTEDLDLSYRAQLKDWNFQYLEELESPAELPVVMSALKSQQYRWNKGAAETAKKNLPRVIKSKIRPEKKIHALLHLMNSSVFIAILLSAFLSIPMLYIKSENPEYKYIFSFGSVFLVGFFVLGLFYYTAVRYVEKEHPKRYFIKNFPLFLSFSMGLSLHNSIAVIEGWLGFKTPFIRTPKFNVIEKNQKWINAYVKPEVNWLMVFEGLFCCYFIFGMFYGVSLGDFGLLFFHLMLSVGYGLVFFESIKRIRNA